MAIVWIVGGMKAGSRVFGWILGARKGRHEMDGEANSGCGASV